GPISCSTRERRGRQPFGFGRRRWGDSSPSPYLPSLPRGLAGSRRDGAMIVIELHDVVKTFGSVRALEGLHLSVEAGEVHGFLGPNGAGKSTTIRLLLGLLRADSGHATLLGGDPWREAAELHRRIAYVPGDVT